jgi:hypothetical protein
VVDGVRRRDFGALDTPAAKNFSAEKMPVPIVQFPLAVPLRFDTSANTFFSYKDNRINENGTDISAALNYSLELQ